MKRIALFGNVYEQEKLAAASRLLACLRDNGADVIIEEAYYDFLQQCGRGFFDERSGGAERLITSSTFVGDDFEADCAVSVGGDGTLLQTAARVGKKQIPILGINTGRLGFLADVTPDNVEAAIAELIRGDYTIEDRALIQVRANGKLLDNAPCALNDVAILKRDTASMISIRATINREYLATYQADGLILSTPTGSTAYSLSNGGPIIVPQTGVLLLTAVAPHSLNVRPIVIPDTACVELAVSSRSHTFLVAVDGRSFDMPEGTQLQLSRAPYNVKLVKRRAGGYFSTLREKMMWGKDGRE